MSDHDLWRDSAGAYVVGALDADQRAAFDEHLRSCERCAAEVVELAPLPALLSRVPVDELDSAPERRDRIESVVDAVRAEVSRTERSRRRWRTLAAAAVVALVVGTVGVLVGSGADGTDDVAERSGVPLVVESAVGGVSGEVVADERAWGTYVHLSVEGLPERDRYEVWVVDRTGAWHHAGAWGPTDDGGARLGASSHVRIDDVDRVVVTSTDRADELLVAS